MTLTTYQNRHGGWDLKPSESTLLQPVASARTEEMARELERRYNAHDELLNALDGLTALIRNQDVTINRKGVVIETYLARGYEAIRKAKGQP